MVKIRKFSFLVALIFLASLFFFVGCDKEDPTEPPYDTPPPEYEDGYLIGTVFLNQEEAVSNGVVEVYQPHPDGPEELFTEIPFSDPTGGYEAGFSEKIEYGDYNMIFKAEGHLWFYLFDVTVQPSDTTYLNASLSNTFFAADTAVGWAGGPTADEDNCGNCHGAMAFEWSESKHGEVSYENLRDVEGDNFINDENCLACHSPRPVAFIGDNPDNWVDGRPTPRLAPSTFPGHGVNCVSCHLGMNDAGEMAYIGSYEIDPAAVSHPVTVETSIKQSLMCASCHQFDGGDNPYEAQHTFTEWEEYIAQGHEETCQSCHMPLVERPLAAGTPARVVREHTFVGTESATLLEEAIQLEVTQQPPDEINFGDGFSFAVRMENIGAGHYYPTGNYNRQIRLAFSFNDIVFEEVTFSRNGGDFGPLEFGPDGAYSATLEAPGSLGDPPAEDPGFESRALKVDLWYDTSNTHPDGVQNDTGITSLTYAIKVNR